MNLKVKRLLMLLAAGGLVAIIGSVLVQGVFAGGTSPNPLSGDETAIAEGKTLFRAGCGYCHGMRANGRGRGAPAGSVAADLTKFSRGYTAYLDTVRNGFKKMPPWGGLAELNQEELDKIGAWLETMAKAGANWADPAE